MDETKGLVSVETVLLRVGFSFTNFVDKVDWSP